MRRSQPVKFNFDTMFGSKNAPADVAPRARSSYSADEVETIRRETFAQGKAVTEGQAAATRAASLGAIAQGVVHMMAKLDATIAGMNRQSAVAALQVGRKLAGAALDAFPRKEVEALVAECLHKLHCEPRIVVRASELCAEGLRAEIDATCAEHGYPGRVVIIAEPSLEGSDCRIEWADGGIERHLAAALTAIEQSAERWRCSTTIKEGDDV